MVCKGHHGGLIVVGNFLSLHQLGSERLSHRLLGIGLIQCLRGYEVFVALRIGVRMPTYPGACAKNHENACEPGEESQQ